MKRQHFEQGEIIITRGGNEKLNVQLDVYRDGSGWQQIYFKISACSIKHIANQLNKILLSYEKDIQMAREHLKP